MTEHPDIQIAHIRARWGVRTWRYEETRDGGYVADCQLIQADDQVLLDLEEPDADERVLLMQLSEVPGQMQALLARIDRLEAFWRVVDSYLARGGDAADYLPLDVLAAWQQIVTGERRDA